MHNQLLHVGQVYVISRFKVCNAKTQYKSVDWQYMIEITWHTVVNVARNPPSTFPKFIYNLTAFSQIPALLGDRRNLVDIIGIITQVTEPEWTHHSSQPNPTFTRNIFLKDINELELRVTLWGQRAVQFNIDEIYNEAEAKPIVILFLGGLIKNYQNDCYYSGNLATHWYFNPDIPEAEIFYNNRQNHRIEVKRTGVPLQNLIPPQILQHLETKTLEELQQMDPYDFPDQGFKCTVTITHLMPDVSWWFPSCRMCNKSCRPDTNGYRCYECTATNFEYKFKLSFIAVDNTAEAEMICLGELGRRIVGKTVQQVM
uniref:Replication protein A OB domain-containing protein n=1 Tax=Arundo donax TaxID=35708 RepID=A0A0A9FAA0_ARUDO